MQERSLTVRALALGVLLSLLGNSASTFAQAAPPNQAPAPQAPPQTGYPAPPPAQYQAPPAQYQQAAPPPGQGAPPPAGYQPAPSPLYPQQAQQPAYGTEQPGAVAQPQYAQPQYAQPQYQPAPQPWRPRPRTRKGMMITGIAILGAGYLTSLVTAAALLENEDIDDDGAVDERVCEDRCNEIAGYLFIPAVGPFIAMGPAERIGGLLILGAFQLTGLGLMIGGIIQYKASKREAQLQQFGRLKLGGNRELAFDVATSPRFAGPQLRLTF